MKTMLLLVAMILLSSSLEALDYAEASPACQHQWRNQMTTLGFQPPADLKRLKFTSFGSRASSIAGSDKGWIYKVRSDGRLFRSLSSKMNWQQVSYAKVNLKKVTMVGETPYVIDQDDKIFKFENLQFTPLPGKAKEVQGTAHGRLYIISKRSWLPAGTDSEERWGVYQWNAATRRWRLVSGRNIFVSHMGASAESILYADFSHKMYTFTPFGSGTHPGLARSIAGNSRDDIYVVGTTRRLFKWDRKANKWEVLPQTRNDLAEVAVAGELAFVRSRTGQIFKVADRPFDAGQLLSRRRIIDGIDRSIRAPLFGMEQTPGSSRSYRVLTIIMDPRRPGHAALTRREVDEMLYGGHRTVSGYLREVSGGKVSIRKVRTLGPYNTEKPWQYYWSEEERGKNGWKNPHHRKYMEAITMADREIDFAQYDTNRDGVLTPQELAIVLVIPSNSIEGYVRRIRKTEIPMRDLKVDGVKCTNIMQINVNARSNQRTGVIGVSAHELMHLLFNAKDMYWPCAFPHAAGPFSLMDQHMPAGHLDPLHKLKLGWLNPEIATGEGLYYLNATTFGHGNSALVLMNPRRSTKEYFILEVRKKQRYDANLTDEGLAIWRVYEDMDNYEKIRKPIGVDVNCFQKERKDFGRVGVQLIQPYFSAGNPANFSTALWDGADSRTGYDIPVQSNNPNRMTLKWADGTPSGIEIKNISQAGQTMSFYLKFSNDW